MTRSIVQIASASLGTIVVTTFFSTTNAEGLEFRQLVPLATAAMLTRTQKITQKMIDNRAIVIKTLSFSVPTLLYLSNVHVY